MRFELVRILPDLALRYHFITLLRVKEGFVNALMRSVQTRALSSVGKTRMNLFTAINDAMRIALQSDESAVSRIGVVSGVVIEPRSHVPGHLRRRRCIWWCVSLHSGTS